MSNNLEESGDNITEVLPRDFRKEIEGNHIKT
jgi:hypothetical protein